MAVIGTVRDFNTRWKFLFEIDNFGYSGFQTCSELKVSAAEVTHYEGGVIIPDKQPGKLTYDDVTLTRGATVDRDLYDWMNEVGNAAKHAGLAASRFKRNATLVQQDRDGRTKLRWNIYGCWPKEFVAGSWDNDSDEVVIESVVLAIDRFELRR
jgi:phage tail-like protein